MVPVPLISDAVVLGLATWAIASLLCFAEIAEPVRRVGQLTKGLNRLYRWLFLPLQATECLFCTSCWVAPVLVALTAPGLVAGAILAAAAVGVGVIADAVYTAATGPRMLVGPRYKSTTAAEELFAEMAIGQNRQASGPPPPPPIRPSST